MLCVVFCVVLSLGCDVFVLLWFVVLLFCRVVRLLTCSFVMLWLCCCFDRLFLCMLFGCVVVS